MYSDIDHLGLADVLLDVFPGALIVGDSTQPVYAGNLYYDHDLPGGWFNAATGFGAAVDAAGFGADVCVVCALSVATASVMSRSCAPNVSIVG